MTNIWGHIKKEFLLFNLLQCINFCFKNTTKITTNYLYNLEGDHKTMTFASEKVPYFIIVTLFFLSFSDRNKIPPTTPRVKFPDRLVLKGN